MSDYSCLGTKSEQSVTLLLQANAESRFIILNYCILRSVDWALHWLMDDGLTQQEVDFIILHTVLVHKSTSHWVLRELNERFDSRTFQIAERVLGAM